MEEIEELIIKVGEKLGYIAEALQKFVAAEQTKREKKVADDLQIRIINRNTIVLVLRLFRIYDLFITTEIVYSGTWYKI